MTSIRVFTPILSVVYAKTRIIWFITTASKRSPVQIIFFILTTFNNEQHSQIRVIVDKDYALENSIDVTNILVDEFMIHMETNGGDAPWISEKNERHNISIHRMIKAGLLYNYKHTKMVFCSRSISRSP